MTSQHEACNNSLNFTKFPHEFYPKPGVYGRTPGKANTEEAIRTNFLNFPESPGFKLKPIEWACALTHVTERARSKGLVPDFGNARITSSVCDGKDIRYVNIMCTNPGTGMNQEERINVSYWAYKPF